MFVSIPIRTVSEANIRVHWAVRAKRVKAQRLAVSMVLGSRRSLIDRPPYVVTLCRVAPSKGLDTDNLCSSLKASRDAVAAILGIDDGDARITWRYAQRRGKPKEYAVEILILHDSGQSNSSLR